MQQHTAGINAGTASVRKLLISRNSRIDMEPIHAARNGQEFAAITGEWV